MEIDVEHGRMLAARPDGSVSPYGGYMCPKGLAAVELHNGMEARLLSSLKRNDSGAFAPIDAETALDEIAARLAALIAKHGPRSVAVYHGTGAYRSVLGNLLERAFVAEIGTPNFFSSMTIDQSAKWVTMDRLGTWAAPRQPFAGAEVWLVAGGNPLVSVFSWDMPSQNPMLAMKQAKAAGIKMN